METANELASTTKPRPRRSWLYRLGWLLVILALLVFLRVRWNRSQMASKLQETLAELDRSDPGWRLQDIEAARAELPEEENSARVVVAAAKRVPNPWPSKDVAEELFRNRPPNEKLTDEDFVLLSTELARAKSALEIAGKLANMPRGRHLLHHERNPTATKLLHVDDGRQIVSLLCCEATRQNHKGDSKKALTACQAALNAARSIGDEPIMLSQMVRSSGVRSACQAVERTLAQGEPPLDAMRELQKLFEDEDAFPALLATLRGERAITHQLFEAIESGEMRPNGLDFKRHIGLNTEWLKKLFNSLRRMNVRGDHALYLSLMTRRIQEVQRPLPEQATLEKQFEKDRHALPKDTTLTELMLPAVLVMGASQRCNHALLRSAIVALAAERYRRDKKAWPDSADQLCPQYLAVVPLDPFDGKPLRYRRLKDGAVIYSVGRDGVDNGGKFDREHLGSPGVDIGLRLWDAPQRRQPPRPKSLEK